MIVYFLTLLRWKSTKILLSLPDGRLHPNGCGRCLKLASSGPGWRATDGRNGPLTGTGHDAVVGVDAASWVGAATRDGAGRGSELRPAPLGSSSGKEKAAPCEAARNWELRDLALATPYWLDRQGGSPTARPPGAFAPPARAGGAFRCRRQGAPAARNRGPRPSASRSPGAGGRPGARSGR